MYKIGFTRELAKYNTIQATSKFLNIAIGIELKISIVKKIKEVITNGSHISKDAKVTINNVLVNLLSLLTAPWR